MSIFSENLNKAFKDSSLKKGDLAKATGVALSSVTRWFNGESTPRGDKLMILASKLRVNAQWLLDEGDKEPINKKEVEEREQRKSDKVTEKDELKKAKELLSLLDAILISNSNPFQQVVIAEFLQENKPDGYDPLLKKTLDMMKNNLK